MQRFFVSADLIKDNSISFPADTAHQIERVLRMQIGQEVIALDGENEYRVALTGISKQQVSGNILETRKASGEPVVQITLAVSLTKREKFEWILQKCTEIGVSKFYPLYTDRTLVQKQEGTKKRTRWERILKEAAEQCERGKIPVLNDSCSMDDFMDMDTGADLRLMLWARESGQSMKELLESFPGEISKIDIMIGPEGGFSQDEVEKAVSRGFIPVSLGRRILRMETAAVSASTAVLYHLGEMS